MTTTSRKLTTPDAEPTVARALEILEGPAHAEEAAKQAARAATQVEGQKKLVEAATKRLEVLRRVGLEAEAWFAARPTVVPEQFERSLGEQYLQVIKRAIELGIPLKEHLAGAAVRAQLEAEITALAKPLPPDQLRTIIDHVRELEAGEASLLNAHQAWREIRRQVAATLLEAITIAQGQAQWMEGAA